MRNLKLVTPRVTLSGVVHTIVLLDAKFHPGVLVDTKIVGITVQEKDANGQEIGAVQNFKGLASNMNDLHKSANDLAVKEYGPLLENGKPVARLIG